MGPWERLSGFSEIEIQGISFSEYLASNGSFEAERGSRCFCCIDFAVCWASALESSPLFLVVVSDSHTPHESKLSMYTCVKCLSLSRGPNKLWIFLSVSLLQPQKWGGVPSK